MKKSWKTTVSGIIAACGVGMTASSDPTIQTVGKIVTVIGTVLAGLFARDNNVSSEQAGVK